MTVVSGNRFNLFHTSGAAKLLTTDFVAGDEFEIGDETAQILEIELSGTTMTSCILQLEESFDGGGSNVWSIIEDIPADGVLDGASSNHRYPVILSPRARYRWSAKRIGGDATSAALIKGSVRLTQGQSSRQANKDYIPPAYDPDNDANRTEVVNLFNKYLDGGAIYDETDIADGTYYVYVDHDGIRTGSFAAVIAGTITLTYEVSDVDDGTDPPSIPAASWVDKTSEIWGAASYAATTLQFDTGRNLGKTRWGRWKIFSAGGATGDNLKLDMRGID